MRNGVEPEQSKRRSAKPYGLSANECPLPKIKFTQHMLRSERFDLALKTSQHRRIILPRIKLVKFWRSSYNIVSCDVYGQERYGHGFVVVVSHSGLTVADTPTAKRRHSRLLLL
ncbi:hypothetical protein EVAR_36624_1 [Eumeta japonica]|uniref:Uncharacterized protein n=1 Tax=Eumeta variegata TaxID=151549 RepID=A0A4C1ZXS6_EUMVA|nr:hypothetical protein EVAR_36624_1 [Eumeta japonica]